MNAITSIDRTGDPAPARERIVPRDLSRRQKAAVIVRLLMAEGARLPLADLPEPVQAALTEEIAAMRMIDRETLAAVVAEFGDLLEAVGLSFPGGLEGALSLLDGQLSPSAATRLRRIASSARRRDPWEQIAAAPLEALLPLLEEESTEVGAVMLSKLSVAKAAELMGRLPGERARRVAYAVSLTGNIAPEAVTRIGNALAAQLDAVPVRAFETGAVERVGAILNFSPSATRDAVLRGLEEEDKVFAEKVRRAIFTFPDIPARIEPRDVPKLLREVDQAVLITALAGAKETGAEAAEFILQNISQRMAANLREEMAARGTVRDKEAEEAMTAVIIAIRALETAGELTLRSDDTEE